MRQFILSLLACLCLTAYSQTTSQADLLVEEAQKLESKQDYPTAITKLKQANYMSKQERHRVRNALPACTFSAVVI